MCCSLLAAKVLILFVSMIGVFLQKGQREFEQKCGEYEELIQETKQQLEVYTCTTIIYVIVTRP